MNSKEKQEIRVDVNGGLLRIKRNPDPDYDGITMEFESAQNGARIPIAVVEVKSEYNKEKIEMYLYGDVNSDIPSTKMTFNISAILDSISEFQRRM